MVYSLVTTSSFLPLVFSTIFTLKTKNKQQNQCNVIQSRNKYTNFIDPNNQSMCRCNNFCVRTNL
ncbi:hypothetical protein Hanom_Chr00s000001g01597261 [Helianthus anomalus]